MNVTVDAAFVFGVVLAMTRVAGFVIASPIYSRAIPMPGRVAFVAVLGLFFAGEGAVPGTMGELILWVVTNLLVGIVLGFATGLIFHLFAMAGSAIDFSSGLSIAQVFDPLSASRSAPLGRSFNVIALTLFFAIGGQRLVVEGLGMAFSAVSLTGTVALDPGLARGVVELLGMTFVAAIELAMPVLTALFVTELVLGIAARFAPQSNVLMVGLPLKLIIALGSIGVVVLLMPDSMAGAARLMRDAFSQLAAGMGAG